jgi:hypothetical protein
VDTLAKSDERGHEFADTLNVVLGVPSVLTEPTLVRGVLTGEFPLVEINALMKANKGLNRKALPMTFLPKIIYGDDAVEAYDHLRKKGPMAIDELRAKYPSLVATSDAKMIPGAKIVPQDKLFTEFSSRKAQDAKAIIEDKLGVKQQLLTEPVQPNRFVMDKLYTGAVLQEKVRKPGIATDAAGLVADLMHPVPKDRAAVEVAANTHRAMPSNVVDTYAKGAKPQVLHNVPKHKKLAKAVGWIPVLGAVVDVAMAGADVVDMVKHGVEGDYDLAADAMTDAVGHGLDAFAGGTGVGEILNLGAIGLGYDGIGSMIMEGVDNVGDDIVDAT